VVACSVATEAPDPEMVLETLRDVAAQIDAMIAAHVPAPQADRVRPKLDAAKAGVEIASVAMDALVAGWSTAGSKDPLPTRGR
jgi:hypothetical protein